MTSLIIAAARQRQQDAPWWQGRTFYACRCGARDEILSANAPALIRCWSCGQDTAVKWTPPAVERERGGD